jgi:D-alanyl-D-alanine carboxypeptidase (penicillin-binding protein 5/6)
MVFERLKDGRLSMDDKFLVSEKAWRKGGSKMFVKVNSRVRVEDLLRGIIIQSGNDACIVVAEGISGSESKFAEQMTRRGKEIGLTQSTFRNSTGWPGPEHRMSARDIALLSQRIIEEFPKYYKIFKEKRFKYNKIRQGNRNPLLYRETGADGLKTGYTEESGYGLAASLKRNGRRIVLVVNGLHDIRARSSESLRLAEWAFRTFETYALFKKGAAVEIADVWLGKEASVPLVVDHDVAITLQRAARRKLTAKIVYTGPIPAPIAKGDEIAKLVISAPDFPTLEIPLRAGAAVERLGMFGRVGSAIKHLIWGSSG